MNAYRTKDEVKNNIETYSGMTVEFRGKTGIVFDVSNEHDILWIDTEEEGFFDIHKKEVKLVEQSKELILSTLKTHGFNQKIHWGAFYQIIPELDKEMERCYSNIQNSGMDTDQFTFEVVGNVLKMEMGAYNRTQKLNWDISKNCKADLRRKEYRGGNTP